MPDTYTLHLGLTKPEVGASRDTWGSKWNNNLDSLDWFVAVAMPVGAIMDFAGPLPPDGWLICDGRLISRVTYSTLFSIIGTYWGAGDGSTTFALPNVNGRSAVGPGLITDQAGFSYTFSFAATQGYIWNVIDPSNLPNYQLNVIAAPDHSHSGNTVTAGVHRHTTDTIGAHSHGGLTAEDTPAHTHTGSTNTQGDHTHSVNAWATSGAGSFASPGAVATQGSGITTSAAGAHTHSFTTSAPSAFHAHGISSDGNHSHITSWDGDHAHGIYPDGSHSHAVWLGGGGGGFEVLSPVIVVTKIIYAGYQAHAAAMAAAAAATSGPSPLQDDRDELAAIRGELAELRALLVMPLPRQRLLASPLRGSH